MNELRRWITVCEDGRYKKSHVLHRKDVAWIFYTLDKRISQKDRLWVFGSILHVAPDGEWFGVADIDVAYMMEDVPHDAVPAEVRRDIARLQAILQRYPDEFDPFLVYQDCVQVKNHNATGFGYASVQQPIVAAIRQGESFQDFLATFQTHFPEGFGPAVLSRD